MLFHRLESLADYLVGAFDEIIFMQTATGPITVTLPSANIYETKY